MNIRFKIQQFSTSLALLDTTQILIGWTAEITGKLLWWTLEMEPSNINCKTRLGSSVSKFTLSLKVLVLVFIFIVSVYASNFKIVLHSLLVDFDGGFVIVIIMTRVNTK